MNSAYAYLRFLFELSQLKRTVEAMLLDESN